MIKMIATDLDGTMLKNDWSVSGINAKAVETAQGQGVRWMTVTGRSYRGAMPLMQQYGINCGYVLMNGAEFRDEEGRLIFAEDMDPDNAKKACENADVTPLVLPIRGGTDGCQLSFKGLPCPNLGTGGHAYHGPYEHITVEGMDKSVDVVTELVKLYAM